MESGCDESVTKKNVLRAEGGRPFVVEVIKFDLHLHRIIMKNIVNRKWMATMAMKRKWC